MNKTTIKILSLLLFCGYTGAQTPNFDYPYLITNPEGYIIEDNQYSKPCFGDWDDDGDLDLMVGVFWYGNIYYYENISTGIEPEFAAGELIEADGAILSVTYT